MPYKTPSFCLTQHTWDRSIPFGNGEIEQTIIRTCETCRCTQPVMFVKGQMKPIYASIRESGREKNVLTYERVVQSRKESVKPKPVKPIVVSDDFREFVAGLQESSVPVPVEKPVRKKKEKKQAPAKPENIREVLESLLESASVALDCIVAEIEKQGLESGLGDSYKIAKSTSKILKA